MAIKFCKSCKKPMRPTDTHCKTCGKEYKNSPVILIVIALIVFGAGYFAWGKYQQNEAEKLVAAQAERDKKISEAKAELLNAGIDPDDAQKVAEVKVDNVTITNPQHIKVFNEIFSEWEDAEKVAASTGRIALAQPVAKLQEIKRRLAAESYAGCMETTRILYVAAMNSQIEAYLDFMRGKEGEAAAQIKFIDYEKQVEQAKKEYIRCKPTQNMSSV
ncbi:MULTISPECIES: hypothetical protein [Acinetobacter]|uniref:Zinc ribbon domain-containing protein n=2 Tax=Acinetobacter lwoffii TaxID=28090 RepID=A0AAW8AX37_ACILW|nr:MULTISPECIES: hypothetical protein [Pseudomonadota]EEY90226.1 hypothetical protein HMPREF0017_01152 [Acinetobacter lwoffii SH145]MCO8084981.1 hypothetical protein [Acinetobacter lwoffii]MDP1372270.1 hypothetical protein [Acinetobacter lwoffii]MDP1391625.1 hypothetical protein [Acinetobacter lwoffii]MDP1449308.1 hypothetical protein [Acinetobacter lwoffii]